GKIKTDRTPGGDRRYLIPIADEVHICYCRVSSYKQKDDLNRQVDLMREKYPDAKVIKDIGSGLNFKRKGLKAILEQAIKGDSVNLYIAHKDRLCRFGFDLIEWILKRNNGKIVVLNEIDLSPEQELTQDLLSILHVFSCRMHGLRSYRKQISKAFSNKGTEENLQKLD
ncbi:MAG: IS607 family transposase, partial [Desulfobacteraceae bacterium]|nr:IS607 family transposase [Desulfobacteraceae bacterium]